MWIFTPKGFISAVQHKDNPTQIMVRARDRSQLESLLPGFAILELTPADYPYRLVCSRAHFAARVAEWAAAIDYTDFKSTIPKTPEFIKYRTACNAVWAIMHNLEPTPLSRAPAPAGFGASFDGSAWGEWDEAEDDQEDE